MAYCVDTIACSPGEIHNEIGKSVRSNLTSFLTEQSWKKALSDEVSQNYFQELEKKLNTDYNARLQIFPPKELIFNALNLTPINEIKVVIIGQDPFHDVGQAMGLSFSVPIGIPVPPSTKNIYKDLVNDPKIAGFTAPNHGCLEAWARRGVLLLNATLTVEAHKPNSHAKYGWQQFTDTLIQLISTNCENIVFLLWGKFAQKKGSQIDTKKHIVIKTTHPSPTANPKFPGCKCFSQTNTELEARGIAPIDWSLNSTH
ncbi:hypothetical protein ScPMuIL_016107 [Solemya velum]